MFPDRDQDVEFVVDTVLVVLVMVSDTEIVVALAMEL